MRVVILSVSFTGTNFCKKLFRDIGFEEVGLNAEPISTVKPNAYYVGHIRRDDQLTRAEQLAEKYPLVMPFRHPYRAEASWLKLGKDIKEMCDNYRLMMAKFSKLSPYWMPVDSPKRKGFLAKLNKGLELKCKTDWEPVGSKTGYYNLGLDEFNPSDRVVELVDDLQPIMKELGYGGSG